MRLLIDVGANLEAHDCHFGTPLHVACAREHLDCVKMLLNAGVSCLYLPSSLRVLSSPVLQAGRELTGAVRQPRFAAGSPTCQLSPWASVSASIKPDK